MAVERPRPKTKPHAARIELAIRLLAQLEHLPPKLGDVGLGIEIQLLKRELARGHVALRATADDNAFLSVVTLVEAALACLTWKKYTLPILDALRFAFVAGTRPGPFTSKDFESIRRYFRSKGIRTSPRIDLSAPFVDDDDGSE